MKQLIILLIIFCLPVLAYPADGFSITEQKVTFEGKSFPISPLKKRIAKLKGLELKPVKPDTLSATLFKPSTTEKYPAIIMIHDCRGILNYQRDWAKLVSSWGYLVLFLDSFSTRNIDSTCQGLGEQENFLIHGGRVQDVFAANDFLSQRNDVENFRIGLMGWDYHSVLGAVAKHGMQQKFDANFMGVVAIYPSCNATSGTDFISPILVLIGEDDDWTPAQECRIMESYARAGLESVQLRYFENAQHGFDDPSMPDEMYFPDFRNYFKSPARGVTMQYDKQAHLASIKVVRQFLDFNVKFRPIQITLDDLPKQYDDQQVENANWVNPPAIFGSDLPQIGHSLFDTVFSSHTNGKWQYDVPFPFDRLLEKLGTHVDLPDSKSSNLKSVLIPSGRSLVRNAAAPEFFKFPRIVVAVDTQPPVIDNEFALLLKDRLYIAYQEKANALEVISYNEGAQRFEFQIVKNYTENANPEVVYANRSLCLSCHQNHAPIFANAPWDETNFNEQVFLKIKAKRENFYGLIPAVPVASSANSIDRSANRATMLPIYNALWQKGCHSDHQPDAINCRVEVFKSMLRNRLSNKSGFLRNSLSFQEKFLNTAAIAWQKQWPNGLAIPAANITDRNPFTEKMEVSARFDPLTPRPPQTIWYGSSTGNMEQVITGLADQFHPVDIEFLDSALIKTHKQKLESVEYTNDCTLSKSKAQANKLVTRIACKNRNRTEENNFDLRGTLTLDLKNNQLWGEIKSLKRDNEFILYDLKIDETSIQPGINQYTSEFSVKHKKSDLNVRLPSGDAVKRFTLELKTQRIDKHVQTIVADLTFEVIKDFTLVENAITTLRDASLQNQSENFKDNPFAASDYFSSLINAMQLTQPVKRCCQQMPAGLNTIALSINSLPTDQNIDPENAHPGELLHAICSNCHHSTESFPPNFLSGNAEQVQRNIKQCAPRIAYRLHMWNTATSERKKTPMPPLAPELATQHFDDVQWQQSSILMKLKDYALSLFDSPFSKGQTLQELLKTPYEQLDKCLMVSDSQG